MKQPFIVSIWLDTRREKKNKRFPVKLRVYSTILDKRNLYPTKIDLTADEFDEVWTSYKHNDKKKPTTMSRAELERLRLKLTALENLANDVAAKIKPFGFKKFEKALFKDSAASGDLIYLYNEMIQEYRSNNQFGSAESYDLSLKSVKEYIKADTGSEPKRILLSSIDVDWLYCYEKYMTTKRGRSINTAGVYLRCLRAVFNKAIEQGDISSEFYPFGTGKYTIPKKEGVSKNLDMDQLSALYHAEPMTPEQAAAKDFFFFSYCCNGMNTKDILLLRWKQIKNNKLTFVRAKTERTTRTNQKQVEVYLEAMALDILERRGTKDRSPQKFVFDIIKADTSPENLDRFVTDFNGSLNDNLLALANSVGIEHISMIYARHSFATNQARHGAGVDVIGPMMGHAAGQVQTTMGYIATAQESTKRELVKKITDFSKR